MKQRIPKPKSSSALPPQKRRFSEKRSLALSAQRVPEDKPGPLPPIFMPIQAKLKVGASGDNMEKEADRTADRVMRMTDSETRRENDAPEKEEEIQAKATPGQSPDLGPGASESIHRVRRGGTPLPYSERTFFEPRFKRDFGHVRIHTGKDAENAAQSINARAFTLGRDIVFGKGEYQPGNRDSRRLLAHELTHTMQQGGVVRRKEGENLTRNSNTKDKHSYNPLYRKINIIINDYELHANIGILDFVNQILLQKIDKLSEGDWITFTSALIGNMAWAASVLITKMPHKQFFIATAGISLGAAPSIPSKKKSELQKLVKLLRRQIDKIIVDKRENINKFIKANSNVTIREALKQYLQENFAESVINMSGKIPRLNKENLRAVIIGNATRALEHFESIPRDSDWTINYGKNLQKLVGPSRRGVIKQINRDKAVIMNHQIIFPGTGVLVIVTLGTRSHHNNKFITYTKIEYSFGHATRADAVHKYLDNSMTRDLDFYWIPPFYNYTGDKK